MRVDDVDEGGIARFTRLGAVVVAGVGCGSEVVDCSVFR